MDPEVVVGVTEPPAGFRGRAPSAGSGEVPLQFNTFKCLTVNFACNFACERSEYAG